MIRAWIPNTRLARVASHVGAPAVLVLVACASGGTTSEAGLPQGEGQLVTVVVENRQSPGSTVSITLVSSTGQRMLLGAVGPQQIETFTIPAPGETGYRLVAGVTGGGDIRSEAFALSPGATVRWTLPFNTLRGPS